MADLITALNIRSKDSAGPQSDRQVDTAALQRRSLPVRWWQEETKMATSQKNLKSELSRCVCVFV